MESRRVLRRIGDWRRMRAEFRWQVPAAFNIAERCCDSWAVADAGRLAMIHLEPGGGRRLWSYGALKQASDGLAQSLRARGIARGDRVAVLLSQSPGVMVAHMAIHKLGGVVLPLFTLFGADALAYRLRDSGARAIITDAANLDRVVALARDLADLAEIYSVDPAPAPIRVLADEIAAAQAGFRPVMTAAEDAAMLIYTSGTTGPPKGVLHAHRSLIGHLPSIEAHHEGFPQPGDIGWTPADWAWIGGLMDMAMPCLYYGVPLVSHRMRKFDPDFAFRLIADEALRRLFLPPTALKLMRAARAPAGLNVRSVGSGGEALGPDLLDWGLTVLGAPINELYGQTECNLVLSSCQGSMDVRPGSMGRAVPGHEVAVIDADGRQAEPGTQGEIAVRSPDPVMFLRYWGKPRATAAKFSGEWMRTGDLGICDRDGYFWFVSRDDDVITSAGYRIGPVEIETCLAGHPDVVMAAVVGVPDPVRTEVVKAFVVLRDGADWPALEPVLADRVRTRVSAHLVPRLFERVAELPMTATGKVMRRALRERG